MYLGTAQQAIYRRLNTLKRETNSIDANISNSRCSFSPTLSHKFYLFLKLLLIPWLFSLFLPFFGSLFYYITEQHFLIG